MKKGKSLTKEYIVAARRLIESSEKFDMYFVTEENELYGAKKLEWQTSPLSNMVGEVNSP